MPQPGDDGSELPLARQIPQTSIASPSELRPRDAGDIRWYKPGWGESLQLMGWRWIYFLPAAGLLIVVFLLPRFSWPAPLLIVGWKFVWIAVALPVGYAIKNAKNIIRNRTEPFCIHCGYDLSGLPDNHVCPECGESYSFRLIDEYRRDPNWFIDRYYNHRSVPRADVPFDAGPMPSQKSHDGT